MEIFEAVKQIYENSQDLVVLLDNEFRMLWCSRTEPPVRFNCIRLAAYVPHQDFTESTITQYVLPNGDRKAIKLEPLREDGKIVGYLGIFFDKVDIQILAEKCDYRELISGMRREMVRELAMCVGMTEIALGDYAYDALKMKQLHDYILFRLKRSYAVGINFEELSSYLVGVRRDTIVNISVILEDLCKVIRPIFLKHYCRLTFKITPDIYVVTRRKHFLLAAINLITNAYRYNNKKKGREVAVTLSFNKEREPVLNVRDNGIGLDSDIYHKAIVPFGLHDPEKDHESLGLAVVYMFAKSVGGRLAHRLKSDGGTIMNLIMTEASTGDYLLTREQFRPITDKNDYAYKLLSQVIDFDIE